MWISRLSCKIKSGAQPAVPNEIATEGNVSLSLSFRDLYNWLMLFCLFVFWRQLINTLSCVTFIFCFQYIAVFKQQIHMIVSSSAHGTKEP